jgi:hypothetical protein
VADRADLDVRVDSAVDASPPDRLDDTTAPDRPDGVGSDAPLDRDAASLDVAIDVPSEAAAIDAPSGSEGGVDGSTSPFCRTGEVGGVPTSTPPINDTLETALRVPASITSISGSASGPRYFVVTVPPYASVFVSFWVGGRAMLPSPGAAVLDCCGTAGCRSIARSYCTPTIDPADPNACVFAGSNASSAPRDLVIFLRGEARCAMYAYNSPNNLCEHAEELVPDGRSVHSGAGYYGVQRAASCMPASTYRTRYHTLVVPPRTTLTVSGTGYGMAPAVIEVLSACDVAVALACVVSRAYPPESPEVYTTTTQWSNTGAEARRVWVVSGVVAEFTSYEYRQFHEYTLRATLTPR